MSVEPRPYQIEASRWLLEEAHGRGIVADEMGLGKTGEIYMAWRNAGFPKPCLVIAGVNAQIAWINQAKDWDCPSPIRIRGTQIQRKRLWDQHKFDFCIVTRESLKADIKSGRVHPDIFRCIIVDECHKDSNRKTGNYKTLKLLTRGPSCQYIFLASGSIARRGPQNMWGPLNVVAPRVFSSYWRFVDEYCLTTMGPFGLEILGPKNLDKLRQVVSKHMIRRTKKEAAPDMPPKSRDLTSNVLQMLPVQASLYRRLEDEAIATLSDGDHLVTPTLLAKITRLRQILVTPKLLDPNFAEYGAGIERIVEMLEDADDRHMCIFTPFAAALPFIQSRLLTSKAVASAESVIQLRGGLQFDELMSRLALFKETRGIALCSIRYAESFDLVPATWGIFLGYEWDAFDNLQAEDRLHRGLITSPIQFYYITHEGCVDDSLVMPALDQKINNVQSILKDIDSVRKALKGTKL